MFLKWRRTHGGVQLNLNRSHSYDSSRQRKDHIHERLCYFPQGGFEQFLFRLFPNGDVVWNFTHATMVSVMYACVWIATLPVRQQKSQSFCPNPWQIWIHSTSLRCNRALWVIIDSAIPAVHQHFLASWLPDHCAKGGIGSSFSFIEWVGAKGVFRVQKLQVFFNPSVLRFHLFSSILMTRP